MQAGGEAAPDRVTATRKDDRYGRGCRLGRQGRYLATYCNNDSPRRFMTGRYYIAPRVAFTRLNFSSRWF